MSANPKPIIFTAESLRLTGKELLAEWHVLDTGRDRYHAPSIWRGDIYRQFEAELRKETR